MTFSVIFTSAAVAINCHYNFPDIIRPVKNKKPLLRVVLAALTTAMTFYALLGIICSTYFKNHTLPLVTLNWSNYTGMGGGWAGSVKDRPFWAVIIQLWIMLFPIFDMLSVFSLVAITLGNNLLETVPARFKRMKYSRFLKPASRLTAALPPLVLASILGRLDSIFTFAGLCAFFLEIIFPCLLQLLSVKTCKKTWGEGSEETPYSTWFSHSVFVYITMIFGIAGLLFATFDFFGHKLLEKALGGK